jgi:hypothetical protein
MTLSVRPKTKGGFSCSYLVSKKSDNASTLSRVRPLHHRPGFSRYMPTCRARSSVLSLRRPRNGRLSLLRTSQRYFSVPPPVYFFFHSRPHYRPHRLLSPLTILFMSLTQEKLKKPNTTLRAASPNWSNNGSLALPDDSVGDVQGVHARVCAISYIHASAKARWSDFRVLRSCASR